MKECTDQDLIARLVQGENMALNEIMGRYKESLFRFICRYVGSDEIAYDLLQETFTKLYFSAATYKPEYRFSTWLFQIALNLCRDYGRKRKLMNFISIDEKEIVYDFEDSSFDPETIAQSTQAINHIHQAINLLPHKLKTALILFALEEHSQEECAVLLGTTVKTIETRVYRARKLLEKKLFKKTDHS